MGPNDYKKNRLGGLQCYDRSGAAQITSLMTMFRDDFPGTVLDPDQWAVQQGAGHAVSVSNGELSISTGTSPNAETIITGKQAFTVPFRVWFIGRLSQRIANQEFYLEVVNQAGDMVAQHLLDGTAPTSGKYDTKNANRTNGLVQTSIYQSSTSDSIFEIQLFPDECWFFSRPADSGGSRGLNGVKTRNIPDPNDEYYIRIRAKNLGVAPASSTNLVLGAVCAQDINELTVEVTGGQGASSLAQALAVFVANTVPVSGTVSANNISTFYNDTTTNLAAAGTFTGTSRDLGVSPQTGKKSFVASAFADQAGTLYIDMSNDGTTWRQAKKVAVAAGESAELQVSVVTRYYRTRFINGATAQGAFMINSATQGV